VVAQRPATILGLVAASLVALVGCSTPSATTPVGDQGTSVPTSAPVATPSPRPSASASPAAPALAPPHVSGIRWHPAGTVLHGHAVTYVASADGGAVGLLWIDPQSVVFRLVPGFKVPESGPSSPADDRPTTWVPRMVAAFNGGFLLGDHVGGYYDLHRVVAPLVPGLGSLAISTAGRLQVGRWGRDLRMTPTTAVVRQNLPLLVDHGHAMTSSRDTTRTWGLANGGLWTANRSALGVRPDGSFVYAYGHDVRPAAMSAALVAVGVQRAMVLDMNKSWPGGFVYSHPSAGIRGQRIQPQEVHSPGVYYQRYTKDFVAVLVR
jgi:hypothetical protein